MLDALSLRHDVHELSLYGVSWGATVGSVYMVDGPQAARRQAKVDRWITKLEKGEFSGRQALEKQKREGVTQRLVGIRLTDKGFPRAGYPIVHDGVAVGTLTSGTVSPTLGYGVAMGRVPVELAAAGTEISIDVRGKLVAAVIERLPFYTEGSVKR